MLLLADQWKDYQLLDARNGEKLERWKNIYLRRPDPQIIWPGSPEGAKEWSAVHGQYTRSDQGGGGWTFHKKLPERWVMEYKNLAFYVRPTGFKHMGLFPEQAVNWDWIQEKIQKAQHPVRVLNLFAYTGGATCAASGAGAEEVVHVDASKGMVQWAKDNTELSSLTGNTIRFIVEDVFKFIEREIRRGRQYQGIIMDPPSYGRGPKGEVWKLEQELQRLLELSKQLLAPDWQFLLVNAYTTGFSHVALNNMLRQLWHEDLPQITTGEIGLPITRGNLVLPCGIYARLENRA